MPRKPRQHPPLHFAIPATLDFEAVEGLHPPTIPGYKRDVVAMLIHNLYWTLWHKTTGRGALNQYVALNMDILRNNFHDDASVYMRWLVTVGIIEVRKGRTKWRSNQYRFARTYRDQPIKLHRCRDGRVYRRFISLSSRATEGQVKWRTGLSKTSRIKFATALAAFQHKGRSEPPRPQLDRPSDDPNLPVTRATSSLISVESSITTRSRTSGSGVDSLDAIDFYIPSSHDLQRACSSSKPIDVNVSSSSSSHSITSIDPHSQVINPATNIHSSFCPPVLSLNGGGICTSGEADPLRRLRQCLETVTLRPGWKQFIDRQLEEDRWSIHQWNCGLTKMQAIADRLWYFSRHATNNRLDTNITLLNKELRPFLILDGSDDLTQLDIKSSQPYFLIGVARLCREEDFDFAPSEPAIVEWLNAVVGGDVYEQIGTAIGNSASDERAKGKEAMFSVLFSHNKQDSAAKTAFAALFPQIYELVRCLKEGRHNQCAIFLQQFEAHVMIDAVASSLTAQGIRVLTVHDSIIAKSCDADRAQTILVDECVEAVGVSPALHVERWVNRKKWMVQGGTRE